MTVLSLHFPIGEVTLAHRLYKMLKTCDTRAAFSVWAGDYKQHEDLLPTEERHTLTALACEHLKKLRRA